MFIELSILVHEQGENVDNVAYNVQNSEVKIQGGTKHFFKAKELAIGSRKMKICLFIFFVVLIFILVLVIALS